MEKELWAQIKGYEGIYEISSLGRVRRIDMRKIRYIKLTDDGKGYFRISLCKNNTRNTKHVHILVANAFISNPNYYPQVNHINAIKTDNRVDNLEWCTAKQNTHHSIALGLKKENGFKRQPGEMNGFSKLTKEKVQEIRRKYSEGNKTYKQLAEEYGVHYSTIGYIIQRRRWSHV